MDLERGIGRGFLHQQRAERAASASRAEARARMEADATRAPLSCPAGANAAQRACWHIATDELGMRQRQSRIQRGFEIGPLTRAPAGCVPVALLVSSKAMVRLVADSAGRLRMLTRTGGIGPVVTVSEAAVEARGG